MKGRDYAEFLSERLNEGADNGFDPVHLPDDLFDFQAKICEWAIRKGRGAIFADCGLGKTIMQLVWADNVVRHTNKPVLILTPLAVSEQTKREGAKFGIECERSRDGSVPAKITVTNYEKLHLFDASDFVGVVCDESSILKSFDGKRRGEITAFMRKVPYRLLCTATAAPNDYIELGTSSEALGYLGHVDMLSRFFINNQNNIAQRRMYGEAPKWRLKGHAELPFWRWVCSWALAVRNPSDLGFDDGDFILPPLNENRIMVDVESAAEGMLFNLPAVTLFEQRAEKRRSIQERCEMAADRVYSERASVVWCQLNDEGDLLENLIPDCVQVSGKDSDDAKEEKFQAFMDGAASTLITKPKIGAWGLNFQHCAHVAYFPSHSYEQYYQAVRRCWRFGQKKPVDVDVIMTEGELAIMENLQEKSRKADEMFANLVAEMNQAKGVSVATNYDKKEVFPTWL